jgi:S-formylglutathione hydrolase FrmB
MMFRRLIIFAGIFLSLAFAPVSGAEETATRVEITYDKAVCETPFTGRVYLLLSLRRPTTLPVEPNWFAPEPFFGVDVKDWQASKATVVDDHAVSYPTILSRLPRRVYWAQAVMDFGHGRSFAASEGNAYSAPIKVDLTNAPSGPFAVHINQVFHEHRFQESPRVKLVDIESKLLTAFHGRSIHMRAGVVLPESFARDPQRHYPVIYVVPGFGGTHFGAAGFQNETNVAGTDMIVALLDPSCPLGHHVFADSENNGPWGQALVQELIPAIESQYRGIAKPSARFVTGHSSGGWSSLWLQISHPDFFGGVWSTAPDPVDFRAFQTPNIYKSGENMFVDDAGKPRPLARMLGRAIIFTKPFSGMEVVMGHGGQLGSFEAVFSTRGTDGKPMQLWDRTTGKIDLDVAKTWERYDIRLVLERNWPKLADKLTGKVHIYMGDQDTFYLDGAVVLLKEALQKLNSDAVVELFPGKDHMNLMDSPLRARIAREMAQQFRSSSKPGT